MDKGGRLLTSILQVACYLNFLEAYSEGNIQDNYIGCYYDDVNNQSGLQKVALQKNTTLTIELCIGQCLLQNSTYAGLEDSKECLCGNNFGVVLPDASCNSLCPGNQSEYCGGSSGQRAFYSFYAVCDIGYYGYQCDQVCHCKRQAPCDRMTGKCPNECEGKWFGTTCSDIHLSEKYIGCFRDNETRAISPEDPLYSNSRMTVEFCSNRCILRNNSIAGLQARTYCWCGESYARYGTLNYNVCKDPCNGNPSQKCGGKWANSVYSVCPAGYYGPKCHSQCHCYTNSRCVYLTGECNSTCKAGWTGNSCNIRECPGDCSQNETCAIVNLNFATITRCRCLPGYARNAFRDICQDIDECWLDLCDASTTTDCTNTVGSYNCTCKPGYQQYNETTCYDVNECQSGTSACNPTSENCVNNIGSYRCECRNGFVNVYGKCREFNIAAATGIILGTLLAISLLINALLVVSRINSAKSRKPETGKDAAQSEFETNSIKISDQHKINYGEAPNRVGETSVYEQIILEQRQVGVNPTSDYEELRLKN